MVSADEVESELSQLRSNADNLSQCLHALLERIEQLEAATGDNFARVKKSPQKLVIVNKSKDDDNDEEPTSDVQVVQSEQITVDPITGLKKKTIVTERVLTTRTFHAVATPKSPTSIISSEPLEKEHINATVVNGRLPLLGPAYESRLIKTRADLLKQIEVEFICGEMVVTTVTPSISDTIKPGDTIQEINGRPARTIKDLFSQIGDVQLKVVLSDLYNAPMEFVKCLANYNSEKDPLNPNQHLPITVRKGEILQVMSEDKQWLQARKVNDISQCAFIPATLPTISVSMLSPFGRRTLVLLGAPGVGRRTIKSMLLAQLPNYFSTVLPVTSRAQKAGEQEGREYHYETKENILKKIRDGKMVEWGELSGVIYGTSADSVRRVVRSGRVCVLDCSENALEFLYNSEFMPFVVVIGPPKFEELQQMSKLRGDNKSDEQLQATVDYHEKLIKGQYSKYFDQILINRNHDVTFRRLLEALENLKAQSQWIPTNWLSK
jgi:guanylate kinase